MATGNRMEPPIRMEITYYQKKKSPPKENFASEALVVKNKKMTGTSSRHWRSVARGYW